MMISLGFPPFHHRKGVPTHPHVGPTFSSFPLRERVKMCSKHVLRKVAKPGTTCPPLTIRVWRHNSSMSKPCMVYVRGFSALFYGHKVNLFILRVSPFSDVFFFSPFLLPFFHFFITKLTFLSSPPQESI
jgi:hypothetical protein